jgi:hypothetical protein
MLPTLLCCEDVKGRPRRFDGKLPLSRSRGSNGLAQEIKEQQVALRHALRPFGIVMDVSARRVFARRPKDLHAS